MKPIFSATLPSTYTSLMNELSQYKGTNDQIKAWVFADQASRHRAQRAFAEFGIHVELLSAYKPLLNFFLEDIALSDKPFQYIEVQYPVHPAVDEKRFLLEAYPLAGLVGPQKIRFIPNPGDTEYYDISIVHFDGQTDQRRVLAPNRERTDDFGDVILNPTGWIQVVDEAGVCRRNEALVTDFELAFDEVMNAIKTAPWPAESPYFEQLFIKVQMPVSDEPVGYAHEVLSLKEAFQEDLYFSIQEWFKAREGKTVTARNSQPGQIIPLVTASENDDYKIEITLAPYKIEPDDKGIQPLALAERPLSLVQVKQELRDLQGEYFAVSTRMGREVAAKYYRGKDKAIVVSGGQHANETTGVVGALRAAHQLTTQTQAHFVVIPLSNPDGYALHQRFIQDNPCYMHHAARYTALGDDLEYRTVEPLYEKGSRKQAIALSGAQLHINLHGYPSHEWTRPLSGYIPKGFAMWTIPKGFFLVVRHKNDDYWLDYAERFIDELTRELNRYPSVMAMNQQQIQLYECHAGETGFRMINGYPCLIAAVEQCDVPLQLITEYPDETIYGHDFIAGHDIQMATVLCAYDVYQRLD